MVKLIVLFPLLGSILSGLFLRRTPHIVAQITTTVLLFLSLAISLKTFYDVIYTKMIISEVLLNWFSLDKFFVNWTVHVDALTAIMLVVVTSVSFLVHLYSIGYMHHDPHTPRFMSYLSLFTFAMLMLVTSSNILQLFFGWEGVGVCSYLLIGFWFKKESAYKAAIKAFIVNRVGDFAFIIGICAIYHFVGSISFQEIFHNQELLNKTITISGFEFKAVEFICFMLFLGSMGKSAQIGLHTWLPDAMEGPTPVSALIHAATMVTAGVFLVVRFSPLFEHAEFVRNFILIIGSITAMFAAYIALTQNDIKKIIAYSTCSQLGYMFMACGLSVYSAAMFHLATHAFFKALLFLSAGSVIHAVSNEQDIRKMGNLWKKIPFTYAMFWVGSLAIAGFWPFAGYYSKDAILESAYMSHNPIAAFAFYSGILAAFCTTFYSWRLIFKVFHGKANYGHEVEHHIHESPLVMTAPLFILSVGAIFSGMYGSSIGIINEDLQFWNGAINILEAHNILGEIHHTPSLIKNMPMILSVIAILLAYILYLKSTKAPEVIANAIKPLYKLSLNKFYFDEIYNCVFVKPAKKLADMLWKYFDKKVIDDMGPNASAGFVGVLSKLVSSLQTGYIYHYAFVMFIGLVAIISIFLVIKF